MKFTVKILCTIAIILGCYARLATLDLKPFWLDEVLTATRLTGIDEGTLYERYYHGKLVLAPAMLGTVSALPRCSASELIMLLAEQNPSHPPLFYLLELFWSKIFGSTPFILRLLPTIFGILVIPATAWCAWEFSNDRNATWIAGCMISISPILVAYSQEARQYSLWCLLIAISLAFLCRAHRDNRPVDWTLYCVVTTLALYTSFHHLFVILATWITILFLHWRRDFSLCAKATVVYALSLLAFLAWLTVLANHIGVAVAKAEWGFKDHGAMQRLPMLRNLLTVWGYDLGALHSDSTLSWLQFFGTMVVLSVGLWISNSAKKNQLAMLLGISSVILATIHCVDLRLGTVQLGVARYNLSFIVILILAVSLACSSLLSSRHRSTVTMGILLFGIFWVNGVSSLLQYQYSDCWWTKVDSCEFRKEANIINKQKGNLIVVGHSATNNFGTLRGITLATLLSPTDSIYIDWPGASRPSFESFKNIWVRDREQWQHLSSDVSVQSPEHLSRVEFKSSSTP